MLRPNWNGIGESFRFAFLLSGVIVSLSLSAHASAQWPQWGGPDRNFRCTGSKIATAWPESGPKKLWSRELGDGYSAIIADDGLLFTMHRRGDDEVVLALDASTGKTVWEHVYFAPLTGDIDEEFGPGPNSTPLVSGSRVFAVGSTGRFTCLDKKSGKVLWQHELICEFNSGTLGRGYGASPVAYKNTVILPIGGGPGAAVMAFDQETGKAAWSAQDFNLTFASPLIFQHHGKDQLLVFMGKEVAGLNPANGEMLWNHPHETQYEANIASPLYLGNDLVFTSSAYSDGGSRVIKLEQRDGKIAPRELWFGRKLRIHFGNAVADGDFVYGSSGDFGPALIRSINCKTGDVAWTDRTFAKSTLLFADGKLIILDEDGRLGVATPTPEGLTVHTNHRLLESNAWTVPTLVGSKLYLRDRKSIMAIELG